MSNDDVVMISSDSEEEWKWKSFFFGPKRRRLTAASQPCRRPAVRLFDPVLITLDDNVEEPASVDNDKTPAPADKASSAPANTPGNPVPSATGHAVTADCSLLTTTPAQQKETWKVVLWHEPTEINKAMHYVCKYRVLQEEFFPHPLLYDQQRWLQRTKRSLDRNSTLTNLVLQERKDAITELEVDTVALEEACRRFVDVRLYQYSSLTRERILINRDFSNGKEIFPVPVYSDVLDDKRKPLPADFQYISENIYPKKLLEDKSMTFSCECKDDCGEECPCVQTDNYIYPNNKYNNTTRHFETIVNSDNVYDNTKDDFYKHAHVMCGPACLCSSSCRIKYPPEASHKFEVFKRDSKMGFGLRCLNNIRTGEFVTEFVGEYMEKPDPEADDNALQNFYNYSLNVSDLELFSRHKVYGVLMSRIAKMFPKMKKAILRHQPKKAYIMPYTQGNVSRFVAHGCLPNVYMMRIIVNKIQPEAHRIIFVASEDIPAGTEILFDYGSDYFEDKNIECGCNTPLCSNKNELPFLATLLEHIKIEDIWNLIEQRSINNSLLSRHLSDVFAAWEFAIFNKMDEERRIAKSRIEDNDINAQVKNFLELMKQGGSSNKSDRVIPLGGYVLTFEILPLSNKKWPALIEDKVNRVLEKYRAASMRQDLPQHPGKLPSEAHFKELLCRLFLANERSRNVACQQVEDWFPDASNAEKFSKWREK